MQFHNPFNRADSLHALVILHRTVVFLFFYLVVVVVFFIMGNVHSFLDATQLIILKVLAATGGLLFFTGTFASLFELYCIFHLKKKRFLIYGIINSIAAAIGLMLAVISTGIIVLSSGVIDAVV